VLGAGGAATILRGLTSHSGSGKITASTSAAGGDLADVPSRLCSETQVEWKGGGGQSGGGGASGQWPSSHTRSRNLLAGRAQRSSAGDPEIVILPPEGRPLKLSAAAERGLVTIIPSVGVPTFVADPAANLRVRINEPHAWAQVRPIVNGVAQRPLQFGPTAKPLTVRAIAEPSAVSGGRRVRPVRPDSKPPRTTATVRAVGKRAVVVFSATDDTAVGATFVRVGRETPRVSRGRLRVSRRLLNRVRFFSVDVHGNKERVRRLRAAR
jgi:hypothetical protein